MKTPKEIKNWLVKNCYNKETNTIELANLDLGGYKINLSYLKGDTIINRHQQAQVDIDNQYQKAEEIHNFQQHASLNIDNRHAFTVDNLLALKLKKGYEPEFLGTPKEGINLFAEWNKETGTWDLMNFELYAGAWDSTLLACFPTAKGLITYVSNTYYSDWFAE